MRVDGVTVYGIEVPGIVRPNSGKTVGAFEDSDKKSIRAWIDPVSLKLVSTNNPSTTMTAITVMFVIALFIMHSSFSLVFLSTAFGLWILTMGAFVTKMFLDNSRMEKKLNELLRRC